ncbi:MAG: hypothetical protein ACOCXQ_05125 [Patescibacteria group bacterium]
MAYTETVRSNPESYLLNPEQSGSDAFRLRYQSEAPARAIYKDVVSYLGEYRWQVQEYDYELAFTHGEDGFHLRSPDDNESMLAKAGRAVADVATSRPDKMQRRLAEYENLEKEEVLIQQAEDGDRYFFFSPPDPNKEDEEGAYGFAFISEVKRMQNDMSDANEQLAGNQAVLVEKKAIRIESQNIEEYRRAYKALTGEECPFETPDEFIANPHPLSPETSKQAIDTIFANSFAFSMNDTDTKRFDIAMKVMQPQIEKCIHMIKHRYPDEAIQVCFHALENRALELKVATVDQLLAVLHEQQILPDAADDFAFFVRQYGYEPPVVGGSCGSTGYAESANMYGFGSSFSSLGSTSSRQRSEGGRSSAKRKEQCVTCPYCKNKRGNHQVKYKNQLRWVCGSSKCPSNA